MFPLSGYFSQEQNIPSQQTIPSQNIPHSAPQQPIHNNKHSSRKNSPPNSVHPPHRRKKQSNKINRKKIDQAIAFSAFSVEEDHQGNPECANDLYFLALEQLLEAFPFQNDQSRRVLFLNNLKAFLERTGLIKEISGMAQTTIPQFTNECDCTLPRQNRQNRQNREKGVSDLITNAVVTSAVALKQSPIPDAITATVNYTTKIIRNIDEAYELQDKAWKISKTGINFALELDQHYNVHEKVGNFCFTTFAAIMKAGIAYKDSPSYSQLNELRKQEFFDNDDSTCIITEGCEEL
ncbi:5334_t:CDS:2 [Diversispora eburnea]|uniref:5334_t:CDS:1 n=1 Tax=Diversispora eburnea TaxID=1213867 RepID=A0A9N8YMX7_9GLOM|nr:5334_t:CDS:2 [Diversispora eburnea]